MKSYEKKIRVKVYLWWIARRSHYRFVIMEHDVHEQPVSENQKEDCDCRTSFPPIRQTKPIRNAYDARCQQGNHENEELKKKRCDQSDKLNE